MNSDERNALSGKILDACIEVHKELGPGLMESVYELCLCKELVKRNIKFAQQVYLPVVYKNEILDANFRIDVFVENEIILELKAVESILPVHTAQLLTYLKLHNKRPGLLINFNAPKLIDGFKLILNGYD